MASKFNEILDSEVFKDFFAENKLSTPTDVQKESIPKFIEGKDISVLAKTGSGKTLSYLLPLFQRLKANEEYMEAKPGSPRAVIILPIKELAIQVNAEAKKISHHAKLRVRTALGGMKGKKVSSLKTQTFDILIGGPGRIKSMLSKGEINLDSLEFFIIDEADQLMDMGFMTDMKGIRKYFSGPYQAALFSATMGDDFESLKSEFFSGLKFENIVLGGAHALVQTIDTYNIPLHYTEKQPMLDLFLKDQAKGSGIIFVNQKEDAKKIANYLKDKVKKKIYALHGELSAMDRKKNFEDFKSTGGILISTDMAAREIDVKGLAWVLNYDLPFESVYYIHRSGRVGRQGASGSVYNFVTGKDQKLIGSINEAIKNQSSLKIDPIMLKKARPQAGKSAKNNRVQAKSNKPKRTPRYKR